MRVDPGDFGPLPRDADYDTAWDRVVEMFKAHAERGRELGVKMLWELRDRADLRQAVRGREAPRRRRRRQPAADVRRRPRSCRPACWRTTRSSRPSGSRAARRSSRGCSKGSIGHVHVCDSDSNTWQNAFGTHLGIGKGVIDFDELIPALADSYDGEWWSVDAIPMTAESWADTWNDRFTLDELLDKHVREEGGDDESRCLLRAERPPGRGRPRARHRRRRGARRGRRVRLLRLRCRVLLRQEPGRHCRREGPARARARVLRPGRRTREARRRATAWPRATGWRSTRSRAATRACPAGPGSRSSARTCPCSA